MELLKTLATIAGCLTAIITFVGVIWALAKKPWLQLRAKWAEVEHAMAQVTTMSAALGRNGGKSLADEIHRQGVEQMRQGTALRHTVACVDSLCDVIEKAIFQTNAQGHWVRVNRTFSLTFGYALEAVLGMGWVAALDDADRDAFMREWDYAIEDRRSFRRQTHFVTQDGISLVVMVQARPTLGNPEVGNVGWFGTVEIVSVPKPAVGGAA